MAYQARITTDIPYFDIKAMRDKSPDVHDRSSLETWPALSSTTVKAIGCVSYILFLTWQMIGLVLYSIRVFEATIIARKSSYQCSNITTYPHSQELEFAWLISQIVNNGLLISALSKVPSFLGYCTILKSLVYFSSFWSLLCLYGISISRYLLMILLQNDSSEEISLLIAFMISEGTQVIFIGFLNFTQVNHFRKKYSRIVFAFFKLNIFLLFLAFFVKFVANTLQLALHIYGMDDDVAISSDFLKLLGAIRKFTSIYFKYRLYVFYWEKLFSDNRNILCHHDHLDQVVDSLPEGNNTFKDSLDNA